MCLLNLAQIAEQTGALLSVSCRLVRSLISSNSLKYLSGCIFVPVNRAREKLLAFFVAPGGKTRKLHTTMRSVKYKFDEIVPRLSILIIPLNGFQNYRENLFVNSAFKRSSTTVCFYSLLSSRLIFCCPTSINVQL